MANKQAKRKDKEATYESASASLLSLVPSSFDKETIDRESSVEWEIIKSHLEGRLVSQRMWRNSWWNQNWSDLAQYILPRRSIWLTQSAGGYPSPNNMTRGKPVNSAIVDPTATFAARIGSGGLMSGLASPSRPWFKVVPAMRRTNIDAAGRVWLDSVEERIYMVLAGSNFYNAFAQECEDLIVFGTAPSIIYEDDSDLIRLYNPVIGEYYLSSDATMRVNSLYRLFVMTIEQIVEFFGLQNVTKDVQMLWRQKGSSLQTERLVAHSIEPNYEVGDNGIGVVPGGFTWREVYWQFGSSSERPLSIRGFRDQPFTAARWSTQSNDAYGRSPGMDVLPDVMQLQVMTKRMAEAIEKMVRPPLVGDMALKNQPSSILPGHITYANLGANPGLKSIYSVNPDIKAFGENIIAIENRIKVGFFNDLFLMLEQNNGRMTAYEVAQKVQEKLQVLGPVIESLLSESLKPKLKRIYAILQRKGMIDDPPPSLRGMPLDIEFVSMLALSQKAAATGGLERIAALIGNLSSIFPSAKDLLNVDEYIRIMNDLLGNHQVILFDKEHIEAVRRSQLQQIQQQQKMQSEAHQADVAQKSAGAVQTGAQAAQVLAGTQIGGGQSALNILLGSGATP